MTCDQSSFFWAAGTKINIMVKCLLAFVVLGCLVSSSIAQIAKPCPNYADSGITVDDSSVKIGNCSNVPCVLIKGQNTTVSFNFKANADFEALNVSVFGQIFGHWMELPGGLPDPKICDSGVTCPIKSGTSNTAKFNIFIKPDFPSVTALCEIRIADGKKIIQGCSEVYLKLVSPP